MTDDTEGWRRTERRSADERPVADRRVREATGQAVLTEVDGTIGGKWQPVIVRRLLDDGLDGFSALRDGIDGISGRCCRRTSNAWRADGSSSDGSSAAVHTASGVR
jgi:hypothetical protein